VNTSMALANLPGGEGMPTAEPSVLQGVEQARDEAPGSCRTHSLSTESCSRNSGGLMKACRHSSKAERAPCLSGRTCSGRDS